MPLSHFGSIQSFSGLPLLADTLPGHLRFRPFALFFPGRPLARSFWTSAIQRAYGGLLCRPELFFRPDRNLLKLLDFLNCFYGPSILHLFISFCGTIHMASCESEWIFLATSNVQEVNLPNPKLFSVLVSLGHFNLCSHEVLVFVSGSSLITQEDGFSGCQFSVHFLLNSLSLLTEIIGKVALPCLHRFLLSMAWVLLQKEVPKCRCIFGNSLPAFQISLPSVCFLSSFCMSSRGNSRSWSHLITWLIMTLSAAGNEQHGECVVLGGNGSLFPFTLLSNRMILLSFIVFITNYRHPL